MLQPFDSAIVRQDIALTWCFHSISLREAAVLKVRRLDHVALHVADVERSVRFYGEVLCLPALARPAFDFPGAWFRLGEEQELHLIGERHQAVHSHHRGNHLALLVDSLDEWEAQLDRCGATRLQRKLRPDGAKQTFVQDPDGHWIELCMLP